MQSNLKNILKLILSIAMLVIAGVLIYKNFINKDEFFYIAPTDSGEQYIYEKFDIDIFEDQTFKSLVDPQKINTSTISEKNFGRQNPFLKF